MARAGYAKRVSTHLRKRMKKREFYNWDRHYEAGRIANSLDKKEMPRTLVKAIDYVEDQKLLASLVSHSSPAVRKRAVLKLDLPGEEHIQKALEQAAVDTIPSVRAMAVIKARHLLRNHYFPYLVNLIENAASDRSKEVRVQADDALKTIAIKKPVWEKATAIKPLALKLMDALKQEELFNPPEHYPESKRLITNFAHSNNAYSNGALSSVLFNSTGMMITASEGLIDRRPELAKDIIKYAKGLYDLFSTKSVSEFFDEKTLSFSKHDLGQRRMEREQAVSRLAEIAIKTGDPGVVEKLLEIRAADDTSGDEKEYAAMGILAANKVARTKQTRAAVNSLSPKEKANALEELKRWKRMGEQWTARMAEAEKAQEEKPVPPPKPKRLSSKESKEIVALGNMGVDEALGRASEGKISFEDALKAIESIRSPYAASVLWDFYANLYRMENPELSGDWQKAYGIVPSAKEEKKKKEAAQMSQFMTAFLTGFQPSPALQLRFKIGVSLAKIDTEESLKPLLALLGTDLQAKQILINSGETGTHKLKEIAGNEKEKFERRTAAIYSLTGKRNSRFLVDLFSTTKDPHIKMYCLGQLARSDHALSPDLLREVLSEESRSLDPKKVQKMGFLDGLTPSVTTTETKKTESGYTSTTTLGKKGYNPFKLTSTHAVATALLGAMAEWGPAEEIMEKHAGNEDVMKYASSIKSRAYSFFGVESMPDIPKRAKRSIANSLVKSGETPLAKELAEVVEATDDPEVKTIGNAHLDSMARARGDAQAMLDALNMTEDEKQKEQVQQFRKALENKNSVITTYTPPKWALRIFRKELGETYCRAHNDHQWAVYGVGAEALKGNPHALKVLRELGLKSPDEHTRKMSKTILGHVKKKAKKQKAVKGSK
ncbi:MAG: HEAT repeat domain-containing protein [Candidatus Diapherotrites archaeon]|nr:HEAT repeat domain-containing protein [Candidatus Diapherotrites archaeon]